MFLADLHIHSKYSRATSRDLNPGQLDLWARKKGIHLVGTGDFTHAAWRQELRETLLPAEEGLYKLKEEARIPDSSVDQAIPPRFLVTGEISSIYKKGGKTRKVHNLILLPSLDAADALSHRLEAVGNLHSDGRPILGLDSRDLLEITLDVCEDAVFVPAHIWTPHFSLFGAFSGFDTIEECFEDLTPYIHTLETGLSSDPPMNWRLSALDPYLLISNSDAHSPSKLGREANLFDTELSYPAVAGILNGTRKTGFGGTVEFYPEEGKYHLDGHRNCQLCLTPEETQALGGICPVCGKKITIGVLHRIEELADRPEGFLPPHAPHYERLVPLPETIAASLQLPAAGKKTQQIYETMLQELGPEFSILREIPLEDIAHTAGACVAEGIRRIRCGEVELSPGYDGEYGKIHLLTPDEIGRLSGQISFFTTPGPSAPKKRREALPSAAPAKAAKEPPSGAGISGELNGQQKAAVEAQEDAVAVIAGPGTGKTRTLISRILWLMEARGVKPSEITAVTFTNKAAQELRERLGAHFGKKQAIRGLTVGTFHAVCLKLLPPCPIAGEAESLAVAQEVAEALSLKQSPSRLLSAISRFKNRLSSQEEAAGMEEAYSLYQQKLAGYGLMDYDDILCRALEWSSSHDCPGCFSYLLVDEFQDCNPLQAELVRVWSRKTGRLFVIGDPDQSIYGFRGSDPQCFSRLRSDYPGMRWIRLYQNYRSTPEILSCSLPVIQVAGGEHRLTPCLPAGSPVRHLTSSDAFSQGIAIAKEINRMVGGIDMLDSHSRRFGQRDRQPRSFGDIAVLYRTHRQARLLEKCLLTEGIPYTVAGREEYLTDPLVRGAIAFFRFLLNPADRLSLRLSLQTLYSLPPDGLLPLWGDPPSGRALWEDSRLPAPYLPWGKLCREYAPLVKSEKPAAILEKWLAGLTPKLAETLEPLGRMAVFHPTMSDFLDNLTLGGEGDIKRSSQKTYRPDAVSLMTFHGAKGLEFPAVFLYGVDEGVIPLSSPAYSADPREERRLLYVGMTRAKEELILLSGESPSPFLAGIPSGLLQAERTLPEKYEYGGKQLSLF